MKRLYCIFISLFCLLQSSFAFADLTLSLDISGVSAPARKNIEERLRVLEQSYGELSVENIQDFYKNAPSNIKQALEPFGYFRSEINSQQLTHTGDKWIAHFRISPGRQLSIDHISVSITGPGETNPELKKLIADFPLKSGQPLQTNQYETAKETFLLTANNAGYLNAVLVKKEIRINLQTYHADINLRLDTGERYYFGPVSFSNTPFSDRFLQRFVTFHQGEPFSSKTLLQLQEDLNKSHYFDQIIVTPEPKQAINHQVPIKVFLTVPKAKQYNFGLGYGTSTGPRVMMSADYRRIGDSGQHFTTQMKLSKVLSGLAAKYYIPGHNPLTEQYALGVDTQKFTPKNGKSFSGTFSGSYNKNINDWQHNVSLNYLVERFQVEQQSSEVSRLLYPSYTLTRTKADNPIYPLWGSSFNFTLRGASEHTFASTSFIQSEIKGKYIFSPTTASRVIVRGDFGYTVVKDLYKLPLSMRYFAGGLGSVRGYPVSSIGPGRYLETASLELQHQIYGNISGAVFYDVGTATDHLNDVLYRGEGVGIIYNSVVGPVQVYVGRAMNKPGKPYSLEFSIGPDL